MADKYREGQVVARLELHGDSVRAYRTTIVEVQDHEVTDAIGRRYRADRNGEFPDLVPLDDLLAQEFKNKGEGFEVVREGRLRDPFDGISSRDPFDREPPDAGGDGIGR